ncbi:MAG: aldehyde ferredoxin oxidoreductase C-terminal domain-containing protein [bacterium]
MKTCLIRIDMKTRAIRTEVPGAYACHGGRGLTSTVVSREVPPTCHPLGEKNKLVFAPGLLSGTSAANSGRLSVGAKSPLTGTIKESNAGGTASAKLARLGVHGIVVEGQPEKGRLFYLLIRRDGAELLSAEAYRGLKNYDLVAKLQENHGPKVAVISIGPAGERMMSAASIAVTDTEGRPCRHAGRGGLGAVMGSKGLKAIVIDDSGAPGVAYADPVAFKTAAAAFRDALKSHAVTKAGTGGLATYGTNVLVNLINEAGGLPTRNFSEGRFEGAEKISGERIHDVIEQRGGKHGHSGCTNCIIQCSNVYMDEHRNYVTSALEYETVWANGANCGIDDLDAIARIDRLCDDLGLDTVEVGCAVGIAMAAGVKEFGDAAGAIELVEEIGRATPLGRILGNGAAVTGQAFGVTEVPVVKRQSLPAYDPRAIKGIGVTYATSTMGADHTIGYAITSNILGVGGRVDPLDPKGQVELSRKLQVATAVLDSAGLCIFTAFAILDIPEGFAAVPEMINARCGTRFTAEALMRYGQEVLLAERRFNAGAGFTKLDDRLPEFFREKRLAPHGTVFDIPDEELDRLFDFETPLSPAKPRQPERRVNGNHRPAVITISREYGCDGSEVARRLCRDLGYDFLDREIAERISRSAHVPRSTVESVDEDGLTASVDMTGGTEDARHPWSYEYLRHLTKVISDIGKNGHSVIVGRGAHYILPRKDTFKVRLIAPPAVRARRVAQETGVPLDEAKRLVARIDAEREDFVKKYFNADWNDPDLYDLVLNMENMDAKAAAEAILAAAHRNEKSMEN